MKRCYQCEFTFEDRQQFCDFDGTELTVVPESVRSFKNISVSPGFSPSLFLRVVRSRLSLAVVAFGGVMLSALVIGYYDSGRQSIIEPNIDLAPNAERQTSVANLVPQAASEKLDETKPQQDVKPEFISTQRSIRAEKKSSSMPSSTITLPSNASQARKRVLSSTSKSEGNKRTIVKANKELAGSEQKKGPQKTNPESLTSNPKRPDGREFESAHQKRDSRVFAILKKTGRILKKPFEF